MKIVHLMHGDPELWARLGEFFVSREVHKELGSPIYSAPGTHWWIAIERGRVLGFASMRTTNSSVWFDNSYVVEDARGKGIHAKIASEREAIARELHADLPQRVAARSDRWKHYKRAGWKVASKRGGWVYGIRKAQS